MLRWMGYTEQRLVHMRTLSITSFLIQACIVSLVIWPDRIGAEDSGPAAFRIEISQPEFGRAGQAWTCLTAALVQPDLNPWSPRECRESVPLIIFGRPTLAQIQVRITGKAVEVYASLDHPRRWYRASGGPIVGLNRDLVLNTDGSLAEEIRLKYWGGGPGLAMDLVVRPSPEESLALKITPIAAR
jgi:hypothetical protein